MIVALFFAASVPWVVADDDIPELKDVRAADGWERVCKTPAGYVPQGIDVSKKHGLLLTAHKHDKSSAVFRFDDTKTKFQLLFEMPAEATHTSGIAVIPATGNALLVDYTSDRIYLVDMAQSIRKRKAVVLASLRSGLKGTSACCLAKTTAGLRLIVTDFRNTSKNYFFRFDEKKKLIAVDEKLNRKHSYRNNGFSQGITSHNGFIYETGNGILRSYVVKHRLDDAMKNRKIKPLAKWKGPGRLIEDIACYKGLFYIADEGTNELFRAKLN